MADKSAKAPEATLSTDIIDENGMQNSDKLLTALAQMQTSFQSKQTPYLAFLKRKKGKTAKGPQGNIPIAGVTMAMSRAIQILLRLQREQNTPQSQGKIHLAKTSCQNRKIDHEVAELLESEEKSPRGDKVDDTLSLFFWGGGGGADFSEDEQDSEQFLSDTAQSLVSAEDTGLPITDKLASIVNKKFSDNVDLPKLKSLLNTHKKPENCAELFVPRVNTEIWQQMKPYQRKVDKILYQRHLSLDDSSK